MTDWTILRRSLRARTFSSLTTILTVGVAVALMLVLLTMREAGKRAFERGVGDMHMLITAEASPLASVLNSVFYASPPRNPLPWERYEQLLAEAPWAYAVPVQMGDSYAGHPVVATSPAFFEKYQPNVNEPWQLAQGAFFSNDFQVVLGHAAAAATRLRLNDTIVLTHGTPAGGSGEEGGEAAHVHDEYKYTVVGILKPTGGAHDRAMMTTLESSWIIHAHDRIEKEARMARAADSPTGTDADHADHADHGHHGDHDHGDHDHGDHDHGPTVTADDLIDADRKITAVYLRLVTRPGSSFPANLQQVFNQLRSDRTVTVAAPFDEIRKLDIIVGNVNKLFIAVAAAVMLSSGIAILLALYNSMEQRKRQVAIFRVLGASRVRVFGLILTESVVLGIAGALVGLLLGWVGTLLAAKLLQSQIGLVVPFVIPPPRELVTVGLATLLLAAISGILPALRAYRTPVFENLKPAD